MQCPLRAIYNSSERAQCAEGNCAWWAGTGCAVNAIRDLSAQAEIATAIINTGKKIEQSLDDIGAVI